VAAQMALQAQTAADFAERGWSCESVAEAVGAQAAALLMSLARVGELDQQVGKRGAKPEVDDLATTPEMFGPLHERFRFTLDVAALPHNAKLPRFYTPDDDGLAQSWARERVWCNPPYSSIEPWVMKAWAQAHHADLIVMLLPANRTEQGWWQRWVESQRDRDQGFRVEFLPGRPRFIKHGHDRVEPNQRPPFGCCLLIWWAS
jgi:phage N-6-adenine-methyltransferase